MKPKIKTKKQINKIRILVIEDNRVLREGILSILKSHKDIIAIYIPSTTHSTIQKIHESKPQVILLDLGLRSRSSLEVVGIIKKEFPETKIIIMDLVPAHSDVLKFEKAGVSGFVLKNATVEDFIDTIRSVAEGIKVLPPQINDSLFTQFIEYALKGRKNLLVEAVKMTKREKDITEMIIKGISNLDISIKFHISENNVKSQINNIIEKLALRTHLELNNKLSNKDSLKIFSENISIINK